MPAREPSASSLSTPCGACCAARADPRHLEADPIEAGACGHVERSAIVVTPGDVGWCFWCFDRPEMRALGRQDPHSARTRRVDVAVAIDLHAVPCLLTGMRYRRVDKNLPLGKGSIGPN